MIIPSTPHNGILITALGVLVSAPFFRWAYILYRRQRRDVSRGIEESSISEHTTKILAKMHKRTLALKDKAVTQYLTLFNFSDFLEFCNNLADAMPEHRATWDNARRRVGRKKLSQDRAERRQQIDGLFDKIRPIMKAEWSLDKVVAFGHLAETVCFFWQTCLTELCQWICNHQTS